MKKNRQWFESRVNVNEAGCWIWRFQKKRDGYGRLRDNGRNALVHRVAYETFVGPIPPEMQVDHLCFTPACCNPEHLRLLSLLENASLQRSTLKTHCVNGHQMTPENTYTRPKRPRSGRRDCRACIRERVAKYKRKEAA